MSKIRPIFLIAGNTVTGVLRGVVLNVLLVLAALLIIASMATTALQPGEMRRMLVDSGLAVITVLGAMISILTGFTMVPNEVQNRTIYPVMARPVGRWQFILGKYLGACGINGITVALLSLIFFIVYFFKMHEFDVRLLAAVGMIFATLMVLSAIIIFLSTFMSWIGTIIVSTVIWFLASYSQFMWDLAYYHGDKSILNLLFQATQKLLPNFQAMDLRYDIVQLGVPSFEAARILAPLGNAGIFMVISLALAVLVFNYREL
jgi:ABC-type transport system involved in multi-copper enzyme maturation permease subunit